MFDGTVSGPGTSGAVYPKLPDRFDEYRALAKAAVVTEPFLRPTRHDVEWTVFDTYCERCLALTQVMLMKPGTVSGSSSGDFVCGDCSPIVQTRIEFIQLSRLVNGESA